MRHITFRQIEGFLAAADSLSFVRAAEILHVTPPAFSQLIRELETALGVRLFDRTTRRVTLTPAGVSLRHRMKRGMLEIDEACKEAKAIAQVERGHLSISTLPSLAIGIVMQTLAEMRSRSPALTISLHEDHNGVLLERLVQGEDDFALCAYADEMRDLTFNELFREELIAVVPKQNKLAQQMTLDWPSIQSEVLVLTRTNTSIRVQVDDALAQNGITKRTEYETANMFTALSMVRAGFGVTILPLTVLSEINMSGLAWRRLLNPTPWRRIGSCRRNDRTLSPSALQFEQLVSELINHYPEGILAAPASAGAFQKQGISGD